ncbi:arylsulfatase H-like [Lineus longissimus]|uniref:arylsulfatase H-like n=1 Tax=Lineus longissimus TaxID=88925 RepID=UPI002B4E7DDE
MGAQSQLQFLSILALCLIFAQVDARPDAKTRPNVLMLFGDDLGHGDVSCYGKTKVPTPNIDKLAKEGLRFERMYSQHMCTPSRSALMTGRLPSRNGMIQGYYDIPVLLSMAQPSGIADPKKEPNLASTLQSLNYKTSLVGKWHLGFAHKGTQGPIAKGFDEFYGILLTHMESCSSYDEWDDAKYSNFFIYKRRYKFALLGLIILVLRLTVFGNRGLVVMLSLVALLVLYLRVYFFFSLTSTHSCMWLNGTEVVEQPYKDRDATIRITDESIKFLKRAKAADPKNKQPFFLSVNYMTPHQTPIVSKYHWGKSGHGLYSDCIMELDWSVGKIMATLKEQGYDNNTLIYFTSDNGPTKYNSYTNQVLPETNGGSAGSVKNSKGEDAPLRGWKGTNFEGGLRVPSIMRWLDVIEQGQVSEAVTSQMDFFPTVLEIVGLEDRIEKQRMDGKSLLKHLKNQNSFPTHHDFLFHYCDTQTVGAITYYNYKLHFFEGAHNYTCRGITYDSPKLYKLDDDPGELNPLSLDDHKDVINKMKEGLEKHQKTMETDSVYFSQFNDQPRPWDFPCENFPACTRESKIKDDFTGLVDELL